MDLNSVQDVFNMLVTKHTDLNSITMCCLSEWDLRFSLIVSVTAVMGLVRKYTNGENSHLDSMIVIYGRLVIVTVIVTLVI